MAAAPAQAEQQAAAALAPGDGGRAVVLRRCIACRRLADRNHFWRVIRLADGGVSLDQGMGRSAYLCPSAACLEEARRRRRLPKALRCQVSDSIINALAARLGDDAAAAPEAR